MQTQNEAGFHGNAYPAHPSIPAASTSAFGKWKPDVAFGSALWVAGEDLSRIEIADRRIACARLRVEHYRNARNPAIFQEDLEKEIRKRAELDDNDEENTKPM